MLCSPTHPGRFSAARLVTALDGEGDEDEDGDDAMSRPGGRRKTPAEIFDMTVPRIAMAHSPTLRLVAVVSAPHTSTISLYETDTGGLVTRVVVPGGGVTHCAIAGGTSPGTTAGAAAGAAPGSGGARRVMSIGGTQSPLLVACAIDRTVRVYRISGASATHTLTLMGIASAVTCIAVTPPESK
jgi:hypothetical protein